MVIVCITICLLFIHSEYIESVQALAIAIAKPQYLSYEAFSLASVGILEKKYWKIKKNGF